MKKLAKFRKGDRVESTLHPETHKGIVIGIETWEGEWLYDVEVTMRMGHKFFFTSYEKHLKHSRVYA